MESPFSPMIGNVFVEAFEEEEEEGNKDSEKKPNFWYRYVDDTFKIWPNGMDSLQTVLEHLNNQHNNIKFTMAFNMAVFSS